MYLLVGDGLLERGGVVIHFDGVDCLNRDEHRENVTAAFTGNLVDHGEVVGEPHAAEMDSGRLVVVDADDCEVEGRIQVQGGADHRIATHRTIRPTMIAANR